MRESLVVKLCENKKKRRKMLEANIANSADLIFNYLVTTSDMTRICRFLLVYAYFSPIYFHLTLRVANLVIILMVYNGL